MQARGPELRVHMRKSSLVGWYTLSLLALKGVGRNRQILGVQAARGYPKMTSGSMCTCTHVTPNMYTRNVGCKHS